MSANRRPLAVFLTCFIAWVSGLFSGILMTNFAFGVQTQLNLSPGNPNLEGNIVTSLHGVRERHGPLVCKIVYVVEVPTQVVDFEIVVSVGTKR